MKIALIAMSGIRCCDTELLRLGLTLPGFVERSKTIASLPSLGLLTLAGMTPERHQVQYVEVPDMNHLDALPKDADLAAISTYSAQVDEAYEAAKRYRKINIPTVIGGPHVTALPDEALQYCDAVVVGEGEAVWHEVLQDAENGNTSGVYGRVDNGWSLADAPMPTFELLDMANYNRLTVQTSRGCPHRCEFCASSTVLTEHYKQKPAEKVLAEINRIMQLWENPFIELADDNTFVNKAYWKDLLPHLKGKRLRWFAETDLSVAEDDELLKLMHQTGCHQVLIGLESPTAIGLEGLEMHSNWKYKHRTRYRDAIKNIQSHGITVNGCFVIGLDGHTTDIFDQVYEFVRTTELYDVQVTIMTAFPGTPLYSRLENEGRLLEPKNWKTCTLFDLNYQPTHMTTEELTTGFRKLVQRLYSDELTHERRHNFRKYLRTQ
ncbi:MAG: cobalamin-dependent protein [Sedimentisphaerales bacterium]|nr:cobalamin-dependent protein [Sedimentisphaerales bacterium]